MINLNRLSLTGAQYFRTPKQKVMKEKNSYWFKYYAGYSTDFVEDVFQYLNLKKGSLVLDPWNGSGTTTQVAEKFGCDAIGIDINPVMAIISSSKRVNNIEVIDKKINSVLSQINRYRNSFIPKNDPLLQWLNSESVIFVRRIERSIQKCLLNRNYFVYAKKSAVLQNLISNPEVSFFYVALFRTLKEILSKFKTSNPTWVKQPHSEDEKLIVDKITIIKIYEKHLQEMKKIVIERQEIKNQTNIDLLISTSTKLSIDDNIVDAIITSPPYCTRIDYAIATSIELALIGIGKDETFEQLRLNMIGTTKIISRNDMIDLNWGETAVSFLNNVKNHSSKASKSYYLKQYIQYLDGVNKSIEELNRVLKPNGFAVIVVQDSYYKDIHLDLAQIFIEICRNKGLDLHHREYFKQSQTLAGINKNTIKYRNKANAVEHVLVFQKED